MLCASCALRRESHGITGTDKSVKCCRLMSLFAASWMLLTMSLFFGVPKSQLCPTLCDLVDCSLPGFSIHGILKTRILEWVAIPFSRGSSWPRDWTQVSCIAGRFLMVWAIRETLKSEIIQVFKSEWFAVPMKKLKSKLIWGKTATCWPLGTHSSEHLRMLIFLMSPGYMFFLFWFHIWNVPSVYSFSGFIP